MIVAVLFGAAAGCKGGWRAAQCIGLLRRQGRRCKQIDPDDGMNE